MAFRINAKCLIVVVCIVLMCVAGCKKYGRSPRNPISLDPNSISKPVDGQGVKGPGVQ